MNLKSRKSVALAILSLSASLCSAQPLAPRSTFYVLPSVEGLLACDEGADNLTLPQLPDVETYCIQHQRHAANRVTQLLDQLEPGGPKGNIQVGFVATIQLLSLYKLTATGWAIDDRRLATFLDLVS